MAKERKINQDRPQIKATVTLIKKIHILLGFFTEIMKSRHSKVETLHTTVHNIVKFLGHKQERAVSEESVPLYVRFYIQWHFLDNKVVWLVCCSF